ncbi:MAG: hypothetical protein KF887_05650 [Paracoccaceae bacterium]|nr:MAG: hypothetical protein KF887_05650 [Paracoccaceae bacterium]
MTWRAAAILAAAVAACGPIPVEDAERMCLDEARGARAPRGEVMVGGGTGGVGARVVLDVSSDFLLGRDPSAVFDACVQSRSGQPPTRPLSAQPGWRR